MIERIKATNPYSGESEMLTPEEHKLYVEIKEVERDEDYKALKGKKDVPTNLIGLCRRCHTLAEHKEYYNDFCKNKLKERIKLNG